MQFRLFHLMRSNIGKLVLPQATTALISLRNSHYNDVIMTTITSQITSLTVVYSIVYSDADQRKHQSSASLAFVWGIHRDRWIPRTKGKLSGKCFHDDVIMVTSRHNEVRPRWHTQPWPYSDKWAMWIALYSSINFINFAPKSSIKKWGQISVKCDQS